MEYKHVIAVDIGGTKTLAAIVRLEDGAILHQLMDSTDTSSPNNFISGIETLINKLRTERSDLEPGAIGIGTAGQINPVAGTLSSLNLKLNNFPIIKNLADATGLPVFADNDANTGALGEMFYGGAQGKEHFAFLALGTGIGVGLVLNGKIHHGKKNQAGEIGHIGVNFHGEGCKCGGFGCFENLASGPGIVNVFKGEMARGFKTTVPEEVTTHAIFAAAEQGDALALKVLIDAANVVGYAIRSLNNLLDLEVVVLGGGIILGAPKPFLDQIQSSAGIGVYGTDALECKIVTSKLYPDSIILGAASLVRIAAGE